MFFLWRPNVSFSGTGPASSWRGALTVSHLLDDPRHEAARSHLQDTEVLIYTRRARRSLGSFVSSSVGVVHVHVLCESRQSQRDSLSWSPAHTDRALIYRHVAGSRLWGTPCSAHNINTRVSRMTLNHRQMQGGLSVVVRRGCGCWSDRRTKPALDLHDPLIRTSLIVPQRNWFTLSPVIITESTHNHFSPRI